MNDTKLKSLIEKYWPFFIIIIIIIIIPIMFYCIKFYNYDLSDTPDDWALFGDYIGGTANLIIGILNIIATIVLAIIIKNLDNERHSDLIKTENFRHEQSLKLQTDLFYKNIQFTRYETYNQMYLELLDVISKEADLFIVTERLSHYKIKIMSFLNSNNILFPFITEHFIQTQKCLLNQAIRLYADAYNSGCERNNSELKNDVSTSSLLDFLDKTNNLFNEFLLNQNNEIEN